MADSILLKINANGQISCRRWILEQNLSICVVTCGGCKSSDFLFSVFDSYYLFGYKYTLVNGRSTFFLYATTNELSTNKYNDILIIY